MRIVLRSISHWPRFSLYYGSNDDATQHRLCPVISRLLSRDKGIAEEERSAADRKVRK